MAGKNSTFTNNAPPSVDATWLNLNQQEQNNLITGTGQTLSDSINNQQAISASRFAANNFYIDSGAADAYVLTLASSMTNPVSGTVAYFTGMTIRFRPANNNTGASTVNVNSAGVKSIKLPDGTTNPAAGQINSTRDCIARYDGTNFILQNVGNSYQLSSMQVFTSSGTWTKPSGIRAVNVQLVGGGGGGSGCGSSGTGNGGSGGTTSFGSHLSATGGAGGVYNTNGGAGGLGSSGNVNLTGGGGGAGTPHVSGQIVSGGAGGNSYFSGGAYGVTASAGVGGGANTGGGGSGAGGNTSIPGGAGGGGGGYSEKFITSGLGATETVTIGAAGTAGTAGTSGSAGGAGGSGIVIVYEYI